MKASVLLFTTFLGFSLCAYGQNQTANLTQLHSDAEKALQARELTKSHELSRALLAAATSAADRKEAAFAELNDGRTYSTEGDYTHALESFGLAMEHYRALGDSTGAASVLVDQAITDRSVGTPAAALERLNQAKAVFENAGERNELARTYYEIGNANIDGNNYRNAFDALQHALQLAEDANNQHLAGNITNSLGNVYFHQNNFELALEFYRRSLRIKEQYANYFELISTLVNMSVADSYLKEFADAYAALDRALQLSREDDPRSRANVLNRYGRVLLEESKDDEALVRLKETLTLLSGGKDEPVRGDTLIRIGRIQVDKGQFADGIATADEAIALGEAIQSPLIQLLALEVRGVAADQMNNKDIALDAFMKMVTIQEELRATLAGDATQVQAYLSQEGDEMHGVVDLLARMQRSEDAFQMSERNKGRTLLSVLGTDGGGRLDGRLTSDERSRESEFQKEVNDADLKLQRAQQETGVGKARISELKNHMDQVRLDMTAFETSLYVTYPDLQVQRNRAAPASVDEAAKLLPDSHALLIEYDIGPDRSYVFTVERDASGKAVFHMKELAVKRKSLIAEIKSFRQKIGAQSLAYRDGAQKLFNELLAPISTSLTGKDTLIIVPDDELWQLPFQALETPAGTALIEQHAMFFAPSMTILSHMKPAANSAGRTDLLAVGDPSVGQELPNLKSLYGATHSRIVTGAQATASLVRTAASQYRVVHLAAHGYYDDKHPMYSYLQLSRTSQDAEDGKLEARDMMSLNLKADLVVLSACETARGTDDNGDGLGGEGLIGMTWAVLVAGVPTAVASQWKVDSASTAELMIHFHRTLSAELNRQPTLTAKAKALQQAALAVMKNPQYRHPFYWAGFIMVGNGF